MKRKSGHNYVKKQLEEKAAPKNRQQLNLRLFGYNGDAVDKHWGALDNKALKIEEEFLRLDLMFPFVYGTAFLIAILLIWSIAGQPFCAILLIGAAITTIIADRTENHIQLAQLRLYMESGKAGLEAGWIQIASKATIVKIVLFVGLLFSTILWAIYTILKLAT